MKRLSARAAIARRVRSKPISFSRAPSALTSEDNLDGIHAIITTSARVRPGGRA